MPTQVYGGIGANQFGLGSFQGPAATAQIPQQQFGGAAIPRAIAGS
jgi:hypothetical protein